MHVKAVTCSQLFRAEVATVVRLQRSKPDRSTARRTTIFCTSQEHARPRIATAAGYRTAAAKKLLAVVKTACEQLCAGCCARVSADRVLRSPAGLSAHLKSCSITIVPVFASTLCFMTSKFGTTYASCTLYFTPTRHSSERLWP